jgi:hypothetical protein
VHRPHLWDASEQRAQLVLDRALLRLAEHHSLDVLGSCRERLSERIARSRCDADIEQDAAACVEQVNG